MKRSIKFNNMLTNILKNKTKSKHRHQIYSKWDTHRDKDTLLRLEDLNVENQLVFMEITQNKIKEPFLPPIYITENLVPHTNKSKMSVIQFSNERPSYKLSIPKLNRLSFIKEASSQKQNFPARAFTDKRETSRQCGQSRIYHNFVNKKKNKKVNHMSKIIDKVISENIQPWDLQNSSVFKYRGHSSKQKNKPKPRNYSQNQCWQKYVLSDLNSIIDRR